MKKANRIDRREFVKASGVAAAGRSDRGQHHGKTACTQRVTRSSERDIARPGCGARILPRVIRMRSNSSGFATRIRKRVEAGPQADRRRVSDVHELR